MLSRLLGRGAALALALGLGAGAQADFRQAMQALERGEFQQAIAELEALAESGHAEAQDALAAVYLRGIGVDADVARAMQWYCRAAHDPRGGRPVMHAVWVLAEYFRTGGGTPGARYGDGRPEHEDPVRAYFWFSVMANQAALYRETHADSVRLGRMGMSAMGRVLYANETAAVTQALAAWSPAREVTSGSECLRLPEGILPP